MLSSRDPMWQLREELSDHRAGAGGFRVAPSPAILLVMSSVTLSAVIHRENDLWVAECPELGTVSQGPSIEAALDNLREATELYLEEAGEPVPTTRALLTTFTVALTPGEAAQGSEVAGRYAVTRKSSLPMSILRTSLVPAPIS
jgi:predicted RNase H-like HicB family nuclease